MSPIIVHPDVRRMLLDMRAKTQAAAISYMVAAALDRSPSRDRRGQAQGGSERAAILTPVAKAYATDIGIDVASTGVQVHGGMGFIEETGAAQHLRDARICTIYEGTNGIQAIDLVLRKTVTHGCRRPVLGRSWSCWERCWAATGSAAPPCWRGV
jgi:acyl-CoA dehydrogenase